ncbi:MAG: NADH dehydrogenase subunit 5 [Dehalococcoidia bacterium]|nr:MAG: NADH dehydrogenase subunit 5 [Dehalococcoidia bacterium]
MVSTAWAWVLVALPLLAFLLLVGLRRWLPNEGGWLAVALTGLAAALFWPLLAAFLREGPQLYQLDWFALGPYQFTIPYLVDPLAITLLGVVLTCSALIQLYSLGYMAEEERRGWFFAVMALFTAAMLGLVLSASLLTLYICWELVGLCSYLLIGFWHERPRAAEAAKKAFITTRVGDVGLLIGILLLFRASGSFAIPDVVAAARAGTIESPLLLVATVLLLLGAIGKSGQFPLHVWLPDAMEGPTPVSALIHAATMVTAGVYLLARLSPLYELAPPALALAGGVGLVSAAGAALLALVETDSKRVLAYSTISQLGLMFLALSVGAFPAAIFHLTTHAAFKALLFLAVGAIIHATGRQSLDELGGLRQALPLTTMALLAGVAALAGIPPTSGYVSKDEILHGLLDRQLLLLLGGLLISVLTAFYSFRLWCRALLGPPRAPAHEAPAVMLVPLGIFSLLALALGVLVLLPLGVAPNFLAFLAGEGLPAERLLALGSYVAPHHAAGPSGGVLLASALAALGGAAVAGAVYRRGEAAPAQWRQRLSGIAWLLERGFLVDAGYSWLVRRVVLALATLIDWFDRRWVNDTGVNGTARLPARLGERLRYLQTGNFSTYGLAMVAGLVVLAALTLVPR